MSVHASIRQREKGNSSNFPHYKQRVAASDALLLRKKLWPKLDYKLTHGRYKIPSQLTYTNFKGIFGLKYSPDGRYLVAACENNNLLVLDPITNMIISKKDKAHTKRCNTVSFIDDRLFATCSDDSTISIWDIRNMKENAMMLKGHSSWVKNIEYHKPTGQLLSSGFDDQVLSWDFNKVTVVGGCVSKRLLKCANLTRMRLSPDGHSMYLTAFQTADVIAIHNLDLNSLPDDIGEIHTFCIDETVRFLEYQENVTRCSKLVPQESLSQPISKRNHLELYYGHYDENSDDETYALCSSLDIHPDNLAIVMRYELMPNGPSKCVSVHNIWSYYDGPLQGNNSWGSSRQNENSALDPCGAYLPVQRGQPTNYTYVDEFYGGKYIHEVVFSPCGNLISSPSGYGVQILAYDTNLIDYRTHIASRVTSKHNWDGGDTVLPEHMLLEPKLLDTLTFCFGHFSQVLCTCFSPTHMQVASGSAEGQIFLHEVVL